MRVPLHIVEARRESLRALIRTDGFVPVAEMCRRLGVSEATARRDLSVVAANGHITDHDLAAFAAFNITPWAQRGVIACHIIPLPEVAYQMKA